MEEIHGFCHMRCFLDENDVSFQLLKTYCYGVVQDELSYHSLRHGDCLVDERILLNSN
jgi:hypothetical protein